MDLILKIPLICLIGAVIELLYVKMLQWKYRFSERIPFDGVSRYPLFKNDLNLLLASSIGKFTIFAKGFSKQNDHASKAWIGPFMFFGTNHPELSQVILNHPQEKLLQLLENYVPFGSLD